MILSRGIVCLPAAFIRPFWSLSVTNSNCNFKNIARKVQQIVPVRGINIYERNIHGVDFDEEPPELTPSETLKLGTKILKRECKLWVEEVREKFLADPKLYEHGDTDVIFRFDSEESLKKWNVAYDKKFKQGNSECELIVNNQGKGVFQGVLDTTAPKDGKAKYAGYCGIKSKKKKRSFKRRSHFFWEAFSHLELRFRGDGRAYAVHLGIGHSYDILWLDLYTYYLFTHGGPYWQTVRIPFSKFILTSKGRVQDKQTPVPKHIIDSVGLVCATVPGPFKIEIDYIGVHVDLTETEKFAYEMYKIPEYFVSS